MTPSSLGDLRQHLMSTRHMTQLKIDLSRLTAEMSTGKVADLTAHLAGDTGRVTDIDRQLALADGFRRSLTETGQHLAIAQSAVQRIEDMRMEAATPLVSLTPASSEVERAAAHGIARTLFDETVQALNSRFGDRALFGGAEVDAAPLPPAATLLDDIRASVAGAPDRATVLAGLDSWFDDPAGGFATLGYQGAQTDTPLRPLDTGQGIGMPARADDPAFRGILKAAALAVIAGDPTFGFDQDLRVALAQEAGGRLLSLGHDVVATQARIGLAEARVDEAATRHAARASALSIMRNDLTAADPYDTALQLEQVRQQIEQQYLLTARLSRLSLTEYLR